MSRDSELSDIATVPGRASLERQGHADIVMTLNRQGTLQIAGRFNGIHMNEGGIVTVNLDAVINSERY